MASRHDCKSVMIEELWKPRQKINCRALIFCLTFCGEKQSEIIRFIGKISIKHGDKKGKFSRISWHGIIGKTSRDSRIVEQHIFT
jgi:hypothetical protein